MQHYLYDLLRHRGEAFYYAFDLLWLDGHDLRPLPLIDRKAELERLVPADSRLLYVRHLQADGTGLFAAVCQNDLEGIVGKWKHGPYLDGRDRKTTWVKVLNPQLFAARRPARAVQEAKIYGSIPAGQPVLWRSSSTQREWVPGGRI